MIAFCEISIGDGGVLTCRRCATQGKEPVMLAVEDVVVRLETVASAWSAGPGPNVSLTGAEPFRHPALPQLITAAAELGFERIRLTTDAGALAQPGNAAGAFGAGVRHLEVVLLGSAEIHDALTGRQGLFALAEAGVSAFREVAGRTDTPIGVTALIPACRHNVSDLPQAASEVARIGAGALIIDATALKRTEPHELLVSAALETAIVNGVAGSVRGWGSPLGPLLERAPWDPCEVGA